MRLVTLRQSGAVRSSQVTRLFALRTKDQMGLATTSSPAAPRSPPSPASTATR